jgi:DNA-binding response OmpR family regulator/signal transduction histidine kinase
MDMNKPETEILPNILIVDDIIENLHLMTEMLNLRGYSVSSAPDGPTALMIAEAEPPDLILLDILMPNMDGYEVCRLLKSGEKTSQIPVIFLSALNDTEDKVKGFQVGGVDFITKPFHYQEVTARIDIHLKLRNFQRQLETQVLQRTAELMRENNLNARLAIISAELLSAGYDITHIAGRILAAAKELTDSSMGYISEINPKTKELILFATIPPPCETERRQLIFPMGQDGKYKGLWGYSLNTGEAFYSNDPKNHPGSKGVPEGHIPIERFLSSPVFSEGKLTGQIALANPLKDYTDADLSAVQRLSNLYALAIQRYQHEREKENLKQQLQKTQRLEALGTLAGGIAHDFNNILFPILGYAEMMLADIPEGSDLRFGTEQILKGVHRAKELVKQILTFCRQTEQKFQLLRIHLVIKEALKLIGISLPSTIQICQNIRDCGMVIADPTQIHQMAMNLITNAFHAMEEKGGTLTVSLEQVWLKPEDIAEPDMSPGDYICLTVADTGIGMDNAVMEQIFDPYFTTKAPGKGTGLGLAVVHGIVKNCYGGIRVFSEPGKGSEFKIYLPRSEYSDPAAETQPHKPPPGGTEHILIVDDELPTLKMLKQMLERLGYQVSIRASSVEALEAFKLRPDCFDLMITDFTMPNLNGLGLAKEILSVRPEIPIIMYSGFSEQMDAVMAKASGIREYLMKPVIVSELAAAIRRALSCEKSI